LTTKLVQGIPGSVVAAIAKKTSKTTQTVFFFRKQFFCHSEYTEVNYGLAIECAQQYCCLRQQEVINFAAPSLPLSTSSGKDSVSTSEGEKAAAALQKTSCKAKDLQVTLNLLLSVKADGVGEQRRGRFVTPLSSRLLYMIYRGCLNIPSASPRKLSKKFLL